MHVLVAYMWNKLQKKNLSSGSVFKVMEMADVSHSKASCGCVNNMKKCASQGWIRYHGN